MRFWRAIMALCAGFGAAHAWAQQPARMALRDSAATAAAGETQLGGALANPALWEQYRSRFVTSGGRVVDTGNKSVSHSEGQGYGMLLAVAANDRDAFDRIWGWTRANLMVRDDQLIAWRWSPSERPAIADMNNASDGDLLVAWALTEAAETWADVAYRASARRIAVELGRKAVQFKTRRGALLLPAVSGFSASDRSDGPIINLSYYVFPAFARLPLVVPELDWAGLNRTGLDLLKASRFGAAGLPSDWLAVREDAVQPADGFKPRFSYNAIRIPLYLAWARAGEAADYSAFAAWLKPGDRPRGVDVKTGATADDFAQPGYRAVGALLACAAIAPRRVSFGDSLASDQDYYPATIATLSYLAARMRYPACASL